MSQCFIYYKDLAKLISNIDLKLSLTIIFLINKHRNYYFYVLTNMADFKASQPVLTKLNSRKLLINFN